MGHGSVKGKALIAMLALALCIAFVTIGGSGALAVKGSSKDLEKTFDVRKGADEEPTENQIQASEDLADDAEARISFDERFGTPRKILDEGGYLTAPSPGSAVKVAREWVNDNRTTFGLSEQDVASLAVNLDHELPGTGTRVVSFQQVFGELETVFGGRLNIAVAGDGRVLSYAGDPIRGDSLLGDFSLSAADALSATAEEAAPQTNLTPQATGRDDGWTTFERDSLARQPRVQKVAFPTAEGARSAYRVLFVKELDQAYDVVVDGASGNVLFRTSLVDLERDEGTVYRNYPGARRGGVGTVASFEGNPEASPRGWVESGGVPGVNGPTTFGNNADTFANWSTPFEPADQTNRPVAPDSHFNYNYVNNWDRTNGAEASFERDRNPAITNLFYHHNLIHDEYYRLGFTESAGNFQVNNFGNGGLGEDPVQGLVQAGAATGGAPTFDGRNNAYMATPPDGQAPWSGMFLWEPIPAAFLSPFADGDFDASIIWHEYTHGLTNRYVAGGEALNSFQAGSMGEGWSDWYALDYLFKNGLENQPVEGKYATGNNQRGIRNWNYNQNPLGYGDIGYDITGPEVHADGEIWTATLWDLREALVARNGEQRGGEISRRIVTDAMPLTAPNPSFLDARDGILLADRNRYGGSHRDLIWSVFAKRGMGASATAKSGDDTDPKPGFDHLDNARNGRLAGKVVNVATGNPVRGARVIVGEFDARVTPITRTNGRGGFGAKMLVGSYSLTVQAPGYGSRTLAQQVRVPAGGTKSLKVGLAPNLASRFTGAKVVNVSSNSPDNPARNLIDDTESSVWSTREKAGNFKGARTTIKLKREFRVSGIRVSAFKNIAKPRFAAVKSWKFETSLNGRKWTVRERGTFQTDEPRPVAPELRKRFFSLNKPVPARFVRFTINSAQDNALGFAMAAELEVFAGKSAKVTPLRVRPGRPVTDSGTIEQGNPAIDGTILGVTGDEFAANCGTIPRSQGTDGWISVLPDRFGDGNHVIAVKGEPPVDQDIDLYFLNSRCDVLSSQATASANESAALPGGTKYVLTGLFAGANEGFTLAAKSAP